MECDQLFKIPLNLEHLSVINLAVNIWNCQDVKSELEKYILGLKGPTPVAKNYNRNREEWTELKNYTANHVEEMMLPKKLQEKVKNMTAIIGEKITYWYQHVYFHLGFDIKYAKDICWTSYGKIDELEIFKKYWLTDVGFSAAGCACFLKKPLFCMACIYADVNFIHRNFRQMKNIISAILSRTSCQNVIFTEYGLIAAWLCFCISGDQEKGSEAFRSFKKSADEIPAVELFKMCVSSGFKYAAKYFWNKLSTDEKQICILKAAKNCITECISIRLFPDKCGDIYKVENLMEILLFLIGQMSLTQFSNFMTRHFFSVFEYLYQNWPYQEFCVNFIDKIWNQFTDSDFSAIMLTMNEYLLPSYKTKCFKNLVAYHQVFQKVLEKTPLDVKEEFYITGIDDHPTIKDFYENFDYVSLSFLINDTDLKKKHKDHMLDVGVSFFKKLVFKGKYKKLNKFIKHVFVSDEEQKSFKQRFFLVPIFLGLGKIELADKNLDWLSDSERERIALKNRVNTLKICSLLIEMHQLDSAEKFLFWRFDTIEERESIKKALISNEFLRNQIFEMWGKVNCDDFLIRKIERKCLELLNWFFGSEEEILEFKRTRLIKNELFLKKMWDSLFFEDSFINFLDEFLKFCLMSPKDINVMKEKIADNIIWWIDTFALEGNYFLMVDALLSWISKDRKQRKLNTIKRYMESLPGALLCFRMLKKASYGSQTPALHLFNYWVSLLVVDISLIEKNLNTFNENFLADETFSALKALLNDVKKGSNVGSITSYTSKKRTRTYSGDTYSD